ncbi:DUF4326 domain-containing protein [Streptomyces sp. NPDC050204]|uniref:DUF4326 domain-containing protein n=1 Tax=Streptomyces sp. NPDC050204 TaxID=3155514 RepID=UPI0034285D16
MTTAALPVRRVRRRTKDWRKKNSIIVDHTTSGVGNPFRLNWAYDLKLAAPGDRNAAHEAVVDLYRKWPADNRTHLNDAEHDLRRDHVLDRLAELCGRDLHCHADILLQWANAASAETARYVELARRHAGRSRTRRGETPLTYLKDAA